MLENAPKCVLNARYCPISSSFCLSRHVLVLSPSLPSLFSMEDESEGDWNFLIKDPPPPPLLQANSTIFRTNIRLLHMQACLFFFSQMDVVCSLFCELSFGKMLPISTRHTYTVRSKRLPKSQEWEIDLLPP